MIESKSWREAEHGRIYRETPDLSYHRVALFESGADAGLAPQAFAIEQGPDSVLKPHFHEQHQFQVVSAGSGSLGRHALRPFMVHYAAPETAYGPLKAGPDGLTYHTLRAVRDNWSWYVDQHRERLIAAARAGAVRRQATTEAFDASDPAVRKARREVELQVLIEPAADGMGVWLLRMPAGAVLPATHRAVLGARFHFVAGGAMRVGGETLGLRSVTFTSPDEAGFEIVAGDDGLDVIVMQFPQDVGPGPTVGQITVEGQLVGAAD